MNLRRPQRMAEIKSLPAISDVLLSFLFDKTTNSSRAEGGRFAVKPPLLVHLKRPMAITR